MLLERHDLVEQLQGFLREAAEGSGSLVLVAGEAGAGKTSLVNAFIGSLDASTLAITGACDPLTTPRPLSPLLDFAADAASGLGDLDVGNRQAIEVFGDVLDRLRSTIRPTVLVIEDIHWADEATLDLLRFMGRRIADSRGTLICTYRDDELGGDHPLRPVLGQLTPLLSTQRIAVPPLSLDAIATLAGGASIEPSDLLRLTGGNPFFVTEVLAGSATLPTTVQDAVLARVARIPQPSQRVVEAVSIAPRSLDVAQAAALVGATDADVDTTLTSGVLVGDGRTLRFRHELARAAVEDALPPARRLSLHQRMLGLLAEEAEFDFARMAHHAMQAGASDLVRRYAPEAAKQAVARGSRREAIAFYEGALEHADTLDIDDEKHLRFELARQLHIVGRPADAIAQFERVMGLAESLGDQRMLADAQTRMAGSLWRVGSPAEAAATSSAALAALESLGPTPELARAHWQAAYLFMLARRGQDAATHVNLTRELVGELGIDDLVWDTRLLEGTIEVVLGHGDRGMALLTEALEEAQADGDHRRISSALGMLGSGGGEIRRYAAAIQRLEEDIEHGLATDEDFGVAYARSWLARIAHEQGRWDEAVEYAEIVRKTAPDQEDISALTALSALGRVRVRRGDPGGLMLLDRMLRVGEKHELQHVWNAVCGRAEYLWLEGRVDEMTEGLADAYDRALATESEWARGEIGYWMWRAGAIAGPPEHAARPFALEMSGDWRNAAAAWREIGCPYEVALALSNGDIGAQREAVESLAQLGARPLADRVRAQLRDAGETGVPRGPSRSTRANPGGLTDRQLEVLTLMTEGLSNGEIAQRLYVAKKTVEHHVSAIFVKLGVETRARAIAAAPRLLRDK